MSNPEGWSYEVGDPSVGIFGEGWVHEACPVEAPDPDHEPDQVVLSTERIDDQTVRYLYRLTCYDCGATAEVAENEWEPTPELEEQMEREWDEMRSGLNTEGKF